MGSLMQTILESHSVISLLKPKIQIQREDAVAMLQNNHTVHIKECLV